MNTPSLKTKFSGEGYEQKITISLPGKHVIYDGFCDDLVTSINGEIEFKLNWSQEKILFHHVLRRAGNYVVLIPRIMAPEILSDFFYFYSQNIMIFDFKDIVNLWQLLKYETSELDEIIMVNNQDWSLLWLLNIHDCPKTLSIEELGTWTIKQILAEEPDGSPKIIDIIERIIAKEINFLISSLTNSTTSNPLVAYVENLKGQIVEWKAADSLNRHKLLLGNNWSIQYS